MTSPRPARLDYKTSSLIILLFRLRAAHKTTRQYYYNMPKPLAHRLFAPALLTTSPRRAQRRAPRRRDAHARDKNALTRISDPDQAPSVIVRSGLAWPGLVLRGMAVGRGKRWAGSVRPRPSPASPFPKRRARAPWEPRDPIQRCHAVPPSGPHPGRCALSETKQHCPSASQGYRINVFFFFPFLHSAMTTRVDPGRTASPWRDIVRARSTGTSSRPGMTCWM